MLQASDHGVAQGHAPRPAAIWMLATALALLAGCAGPRIEDPPWQPGEMPQTYAVQGKVGWRSATDRGSAALSWYQREAEFLLLLTGPLGRGMVELRGDAASVVLTTDDRTQAAASAEQLLLEVTGLWLPVEPARWWIRGQAAPGSGGVVARDATGRPARIEQRGWVIDYTAWDSSGDLLLPRRLQMQRDDVSLRFVIGRWDLGAASVALALDGDDLD